MGRKLPIAPPPWGAAVLLAAALAFFAFTALHSSPPGPVAGPIWTWVGCLAVVILLVASLLAGAQGRSIAAFFRQLPAALDGTTSFDNLLAEAPSGLQEFIECLQQYRLRVNQEMAELALLHNTAAAAASGLDLQTTLKELTTAIANYYTIGFCSILLADPVKRVLRIAAIHGFPEDQLLADKLHFSQGCTGWVATHGETVVVDDVDSDQRYLPLAPGMRSEIAVPLKVGQRLIGVLDLESDQPAAFSACDAELLQAVAAQAAIIIDNARLYQEAQQRIKELSILYDVTAALSTSIELADVLDSVVDMMVTMLDTDTCSLFLLDEASQTLSLKASRGVDPSSPLAHLSLRLGEGAAGWCAQHRKPIIIDDVSQDDRFAFGQGAEHITTSLMCVPLLHGEKVIGVITVGSVTPRQFTDEELKLTYIIASRATLAIENAQLYEATQRLAVTDGLTGLYNHRYFQEQLQDELDRATRFNQSVSLIMLDFDRFKRFNDTFGHPAGDRLLHDAARLLRQSIRRIDIPARYGGEEFAVILPETDKAGAMVLAERIRQTMETHLFQDNRGRPVVTVTVSLGVATYPEDASTRQELVSCSDLALYRAKKNGRNRTVAFGQNSEQT